MWPNSYKETTREAGRATALHGNDAIRQDYPDQETVDYYLAKANATRARSFRQVFTRGWKALHRFVRRQVSPCRRVKLPPTTA